MVVKEWKDQLKLKSVDRVSKLPVVESGYHYASEFYTKVKNSNSLFRWGLGNVEGGVVLVVDKSLTFVPLIETPLYIVDQIVCKGLDQVEDRVPAITYPTQMLVSTTKDYVTSKFIQPVLKRADSVKQIGLSGATKYGELAATRFDSALNVADKYVDKYLPDAADSTDAKDTMGSNSKTAQAIQHANRFSRKLQRRLTRRTIAEAKALRQQSVDTMQCVLYFADLLVRDPKQFADKVRAVWAHLSEDEPENQLPPANLEQLITMVAREMSRRFVHLTNFTASTASQLPLHALHAAHIIIHQTAYMLDSALKIVHLDGIKEAAIAKAQTQLQKLNEKSLDLQKFARLIVEAIFPNLSTETSPTVIPLEQIKPTLKKEAPTDSNNISNNVQSALVVHYSNNTSPTHHHSHALQEFIEEESSSNDENYNNTPTEEHLNSQD